MKTQSKLSYKKYITKNHSDYFMHKTLLTLLKKF